MRLSTVNGRATLMLDSQALDIERASKGRFGADGQALFERWDDFRQWAAALGNVERADAAIEWDDTMLGSPVPCPRQVFAIGLNYGKHVEESKTTRPPAPSTFTKFPSCIVGPNESLRLPSDSVDWEAELVVVVGRRAERVAVKEAWSFVAGVCVGQDISERVVQRLGDYPQFSLGKSFPGFGPIGPWLVTPDEFEDPDDLIIECSVNGDLMQKDTTASMIFSVGEIVAWLSSILPLLPGDIIFAGTPSGVGMARDPQRFLRDGDVLTTSIEGIGEIRQTCVSAGETAAVFPESAR